MVVYAFNPSSQEQKQVASLSSQPARAAQKDLRQENQQTALPAHPQLKTLYFILCV